MTQVCEQGVLINEHEMCPRCGASPADECQGLTHPHEFNTILRTALMHEFDAIWAMYYEDPCTLSLDEIDLTAIPQGLADAVKQAIIVWDQIDQWEGK